MKNERDLKGELLRKEISDWKSSIFQNHLKIMLFSFSSIVVLSAFLAGFLDLMKIWISFYQMHFLEKISVVFTASIYLIRIWVIQIHLAWVTTGKDLLLWYLNKFQTFHCVIVNIYFYGLYVVDNSLLLCVFWNLDANSFFSFQAMKCNKKLRMYFLKRVNSRISNSLINIKFIAKSACIWNIKFLKYNT